MLNDNRKTTSLMRFDWFSTRASWHENSVLFYQLRAYNAVHITFGCVRVLDTVSAIMQIESFHGKQKH